MSIKALVERTVMQLLLKGGCNYGRAPDIERMIRQQIGRELLKNPNITEDVEDLWWVGWIQEVCKMEEDNDN